jgi:DNA polymerase I-like protein with 3'-5' exonuclease and polymerase domains
MRWEYVAWDIEASGLKLHMDGHFIRCMSISNGKISYAFPNFDDALFQKVWQRFMLSDVKKIAHNLQYENSSQKVINGYWVNSWAWDTMLSAHILNNKKPTGLKYCTYAEFGVIGYDASADEYMKATPKDVKLYGTNAINKIADAPILDLLMYNALDSLFTYKLFHLHRHKATEPQLECIHLYTETAVSLSKMTENGFSVDASKFEETQKGIQETLNTLENEIMSSPEVALWNKDTPFNFNSTQQLSHLVFDILGIKPVNYTDKGTASMDQESMEKMGHPLLKKILEYREWAKMHSTYIEGWRRECINGIVHSQFSLNTTDTGRGSSQNPNSQNSYKRDKKKKKLTRCIVGTRRKDARIMEYDFHGQETYMTMFYSKDPAYKKYLTEPDSDMHRTFACRAFLLEPNQILKEYRQEAKTSVFALAYGAYYKLIAVALWEYIQATPALKEHLAKKGFTTYEQYEKHAESLDKYFWTDMFGVHDKWRKEQWKIYNKHGYLESYTGFRLHPPMSRNATMNYAPQGTGSQCTFYVINHVLADIEKYNKGVLIIGYIHDSIIVECPLEDEAWLDERMWWYATQQIQTEWKWILIPFVLEKERSAINGTWDNMYDCGELTGGYAEPKNEDERKL